jgi:hypothetical protein
MMAGYSEKEIKKKHKSAYPILSKGGQLYDDEDDLKEALSMQQEKKNQEKEHKNDPYMKMQQKAIHELQKKFESPHSKPNAEEGVYLNGVTNVNFQNTLKQKEVQEYHSEIINDFIDSLPDTSGAKLFLRGSRKQTPKSSKKGKAPQAQQASSAAKNRPPFSNSSRKRKR